MRRNIVKSLAVQNNTGLSSVHKSLTSDPAHHIRAILLEGSSGDFLWTYPHSPPPPPASTYNMTRALKKRQDAFLSNPMHEASERTARGSIEKQVWGGMFPRTAQNNVKQGKEIEWDVDSDPWHLSSSFAKPTMKITLYKNLWITKHLFN